MNCVVLFALLAALVSGSSAQGATCESISNCTPDMSGFNAGGSPSKEDIEKACKTVREAMQCFRDAMADCRKNQNIPESTIKSLESQMDTYDEMLSGHCASSGSGALKFTAVTVVSTFLALIL